MIPPGGRNIGYSKIIIDFEWKLLKEHSRYEIKTDPKKGQPKPK